MSLTIYITDKLRAVEYALSPDVMYSQRDEQIDRNLSVIESISELHLINNINAYIHTMLSAVVLLWNNVIVHMSRDLVSLSVMRR